MEKVNSDREHEFGFNNLVFVISLTNQINWDHVTLGRLQGILEDSFI